MLIKTLVFLEKLSRSHPALFIQAGIGGEKIVNTQKLSIMNRAIKFRGKRKGVNNEWVYGYLVVYDGGEHYIYAGAENYRVIPETVGQFTGLTDKNGNEIYEGDVLSVKPKDANYPIKYVILINETSAFRMRFIDRYTNNESSFYDKVIDCDKYQIFEVVGNIHQNPSA